MLILENQCTSVSFDEKGRLVSLLSRAGGKEFLASDISAASPFAIWTEFTSSYGSKPTEPSKIAAKVFTPDSSFSVFDGVSREDGALILRYHDGHLAVKLTAVLEHCVLSMLLSISNSGLEPIRLLPVFPCLGALDLDEQNAQMLIMNQAGYVGPMWTHRGGFYGDTWKHSAQFGCLFEGRECLGFIIEDATFGCKDISYQKPAFEVRYAPGMTLGPGETVELPRTSLLIYSGDWMRTAVAYGNWFRETVKPDPVTEKVRNISSYTGVWAVKREEGLKDDGSLILQMDTFDELPDAFRHDPYQVKEYAFYCELSSHPPLKTPSVCGGDGRRHTDGWNEVRQDMGGAKAMRRGVEAVHQMGRMVTLYVEGLITPPESDLYVHIPEALYWVFSDLGGTEKSDYSAGGWYHMCPGSQWQDHLAQMCARLVRETGCDGIRLDCLGVHFKPCWNKTHRHDSPYDYNKWMLSLLEKVAGAVKAVNPNALLSTEYPVDYFALRFNHALFQPFDELVWHTLNAPSPLRVALPHYRLDSWYGGAVAQAMQLLPNSASGDSRWFEARAAIAPMFLGENTVMPDPLVSREDARCRWLRTGEGELILLTRPDAPENPNINISAYKTTGELPLKADGAETVVSLALEYEPAEASVCDVMGHKLEPLSYTYDGVQLSFCTHSSFITVVLRREKGPVPVLIESPEQTAAGGEVILTFSSPFVSEPVTAALCIEGLEGAAHIPVTIPGTGGVYIPKSAFPGRYVARLTGSQISDAIRIIQVNQCT